LGAAQGKQSRGREEEVAARNQEQETEFRCLTF
jgi:hypothetical protein